LSGELLVWHTITLTFDGPQTSETAEPNPFTDYRLDVVFKQGYQVFVVPGYLPRTVSRPDRRDGGKQVRREFRAEHCGHVDL